MPRSASGRPDITLLRRLNLFWLVAIVVLLAGGGASASQHISALWQSWRGPAMAALSLAFLGWYLLLTQGRSRFGWPLPRRVSYPWLASGFIITALLLPFDQGFLGLTYALMGASMMLPLGEMFVPVGVAILMNAWSLGILPPTTHGYSWSDTLGKMFEIAMSAGIVLAITALVRERFQRERLFGELSEAHRQLRLSAVREVELAALRERNRLAREMHDSLGHALVLIAVKIEAAQRLQAVDAERATAEWEDTKRLVRSTMTDLRASLVGLRLPALDEHPFDTALAELAMGAGCRSGVVVSVAVADEAVTLDRPVQEALYRVAQEALVNVDKHARARRATLTLALRDDVATLEVGDDGVGLDAAPRPPNGHYGIVGMRERVEALDGTLTWGRAREAARRYAPLSR